MRPSPLPGMGVAVLLLALSCPALAVPRTFVASFGADSNPCSLTAPCRTFAAALAQTNAGGEIIVLDSAGYGPVTIAQSVSIVAPDGIYAGVTALTGNGVTVNPGPGGRVVLRGLSVNGQGGNIGILVSSGAEVHIERCVVSNMAQDGIRIENPVVTHVSGSVLRLNGQRGIQDAGGSETHVSDTRVVQNGFQGVLKGNAGMLVLDRVQVESNGGVGVDLTLSGGTGRLVLRDSKVAGNAAEGVALGASVAGTAAHGTVDRSAVLRNASGLKALADGAAAASLAIDGSVASENGGDGIVADGATATVYLRGSTVTRNNAGLNILNSAVINSCGNNLVALNTAAGSTPATVPCNQ